jgi:integrase
MAKSDPSDQRRSRRERGQSRRRAQATGHLVVAWRRDGPKWRMKYRLPDGTESKRTLGLAWVVRDDDRPEGYRPRRGRPPEGWLSEDEAHRRLAEFLDQHTRSTPPERVSFDRCLDGFLARCEEKELSPNTMRTYRQIVVELRARWGADPEDEFDEGWRVVDVDQDELEDYRDDLEERGLAGSTLNQRRAVLSGVFKVARRRFQVNVDPMDGFERAAVRNSGDLEVYSVEELWALVRCVLASRHHPPPARRLAAVELTTRAIQDRLDAAIITIAALCGLGRSEILGLRWRAVLFEQRAIVVRRSYTDVGGDRLPKGQRVHSVPMAPQVHDMLTPLRPDDVDPDARVFPGERGGAMDASALDRRYKLAQQAANVRPLRFHDLRHTFGTQAIAVGAEVHDVQKWMGHRHLSTTMRYVHYRPQQRAADLLGQRFAGAAAEFAGLFDDQASGVEGMPETS